jgi:hypothetical protein
MGLDDRLHATDHRGSSVVEDGGPGPIQSA